MYKFIFIVVILLLFLSSFCSTATAATDDDDKRFCNASDPIFSESEEIHAMLARDRYINFTDWNTTDTTDYDGERSQKIPYGYIKEMILHLSSVPKTDGSINARVFFTSNGAKLFDVKFNNCTREDNSEFSPYCPLREQFIKFKFFKYGVKIDYVYISKNGTQYPIRTNDDYPDGSISTGCLEYPIPNTVDEPVNQILFSESPRTEYSNIDGLLIKINCNTTDVKKILVKCAPIPVESNNSG